MGILYESGEKALVRNIKYLIQVKKANPIEAYRIAWRIRKSVEKKEKQSGK